MTPRKSAQGPNVDSKSDRPLHLFACTSMATAGLLPPPDDSSRGLKMALTHFLHLHRRSPSSTAHSVDQSRSSRFPRCKHSMDIGLCPTTLCCDYEEEQRPANFAQAAIGDSGNMSFRRASGDDIGIPIHREYRHATKSSKTDGCSPKWSSPSTYPMTKLPNTPD